MIIKEEIFVITMDDIKIPYFSSEISKNSKKEVIVSDNVLVSCLDWLEENKIKNPIIYLGLWFEEPKNGETQQMNWAIGPKLMKRIVKLKGTLCTSSY